MTVKPDPQRNSHLTKLYRMWGSRTGFIIEAIGGRHMGNPG